MSKQLLTHSRMQSFKACRKKHEFEYELGIRKEVDSKALRMGAAGHEGLDVYRKTQDIEKALGAVRTSYGPCPDEFDDYEWAMERETVECLVSGYVWRWEEQPVTVIASEQSFRLPLTNPETGAATPLWDAAGKIDGIVEIDGRLLVLESKFVSESLEQDGVYWRRLQLDSQISLYCWAARQMGYNVSGVLYDAVRKPSIAATPIPLLDDDGKKIVLDRHGERVFNRIRPKKKCEHCQGTGEVCQGVETTHAMPTMTADCECTYGAPRQTADAEKGWVLQSRPMTSDEWQEKLFADMGERPEFYFSRIEIARLDADIDECMSEMWDIQQTIREAQLRDRWYKTVSRNTCQYCAFFGLCTSKWNGGPTPDGFVRVENVHPELT
ncbi:PD-(D/E)XK nuclease superfamily protein [Planctomycetes bacterium Pan216]|uniref:PD-(D/E)XK nuclease superfamily protein n=1 Tax=Kolteria novifilia TaxID=2527975 RepID=A0A518B2R0_9BACT|nr:PD-(D/E)XK nuclease superfamily protein [Planctomycetes bacterium Pan216]